MTDRTTTRSATGGDTPITSEGTPPTPRRLAFGAAATLLCCTLLASAAVQAADAPTTATDEPSSAESRTDGATRAADPPGSDTADPSPEVFVPTEEISEDFTVSFPVDI